MSSKRTILLLFIIIVFVFLISYYDYKVQGEAGKGKNIITLIASKVRYGDSGRSDLGYDGDKCKLYNSIEEMISDEIPF